MLTRLGALVVTLVVGAGTWAQAVPLRLQPAGHSATVERVRSGVVEVRTTGGDPYVLCREIKAGYDATKLTMLSFDYICDEGLDYFEVYMIAPVSSWVNAHLPDIEPAEEWTEIAVDVSAIRPDEWTGEVTQFRIDFGGGEGNLVRVRNIQLRAMTDEEAQAKADREAEEERRMSELRDRVNASTIAPGEIVDADNVIAATHSMGNTHIAVLGKDLDLATQLREHADKLDPNATLPPALVVGEGASEGNHTIVRILNRHHICEAQFLAYPPEVKGGVQVGAGVMDGETRIVTAPISDRNVRELRIFDANGNWVRSVTPPEAIEPPYSVEVGDFVGVRDGEEIAVAGAMAEGEGVTVAILSGEGEALEESTVAVGEASGRVTLSEADGSIIVHVSGSPRYHVIGQGGIESVEAGLDDDCTGVYAGTNGLVASISEPTFSSLARIDGGERINVGERENLFWVTVDGAFDGVPEGEYIRHSRFAHIRTDFGSPNAATPDFESTDPEFWAGEEYREQARGRVSKYDTDPPVCWEPCFTHRWFAGQAEEWAGAMDEETGLPAYVLVSRENETGYYGEFGATKSFVSGSYAPHVAPIESFYTYPQRVFLRELAEKFRANPEHFVAVEPNHEMEINADSQETHGDYNPNMVRAFYRYLASLYGGVEGINEVFGTEFSEERFDAPRDLGRGDWDRYSTENPYYELWMRFLNYVIYRVVSGTYREALLAGFPPEAIKCHQIPDHYAISSLTAFSQPARRITPIDWNLNAGVGYGCTKYGVWFNQEHNCVQGPYSSGFDAMVIGEYQSLHPEAEIAYQQLEYMRTHGVQFLHNMNWPKSHDEGYNASLAEALKRLAEEDQPRPGQTGGTGQVRRGAGNDIVQIGVGEERTGLLKSVDADGDWDGEVYVVPFHSHVAIESIADEAEATLGDEPMSFGPFEAIDAGNLVEVSCRMRGDGLRLATYHHGIEMAELAIETPGTDGWEHVRMLVRVQIDTDSVRLELTSAGTTELRELLVARHSEQTTKLKKGVFAGERHKGGVTFDVVGR